MACIQLQYSIGVIKFNEYAFGIIFSSSFVDKIWDVLLSWVEIYVLEFLDYKVIPNSTVGIQVQYILMSNE